MIQPNIVFNMRVGDDLILDEEMGRLVVSTAMLTRYRLLGPISG